jgi:RNA polymerase sigma-70 factor (ECF subfamily)
MDTPLDAPPDALLRHGQFVCALAHQLLRDSHQAEDLAQEAWVRHLRERPEAEHSRGWFRVVLRNLAVNLGRGEARRVTREAGTARPERLPSAAEEAEQAELLRNVVEAVLALEEPYRRVVLLRYYRGLDATQVAAELGASAATVRSQEHRALAKLRERLDRGSGGARAAWAAVLLRLAGPPPATVWPRWTPTAAAAIVVALAGVALWHRSPAPIAATPAIPSPVVATVEASASPAPSRTPAASRDERTAIAPAGANRETVVSASTAEIHGRFLFPGGAPAAGAAFTLDGWAGNSERVLRYGEPESWRDLEGVVDAEGRFVLCFDPPRAYQFSLDAKAVGHAGASWRWSEIPSGARLDLGEIELPIGATIEGRVLDRDGEPVSGPGWSVYVRTGDLGEGEGRDETQVIVDVDPVTGIYRAEDVWPSRVEVHGYRSVTNDFGRRTLVAESGRTIPLDIVYDGPDFAHTIAVAVSCTPFYIVHDVAPENVHLVGPGGERRTAQRAGESYQSFRFEDLAPGTYALEIDDPRFELWSRPTVSPGEHVSALLRGNAAVRLSVTDALANAIVRYAVRVTLTSIRSSGNTFLMHDGKGALEGGLLAGLIPGDCAIEVLTPDGARATSTVRALAPNETRAVAVHIDPVLALEGRVVFSDGRPAAGAELGLLTPAEIDDSEASPILLPGTATTTDERLFRRWVGAGQADEGAFRLPVPGPGTYLVLAQHLGVRRISAPATIGSEGPTDENGSVEIVLPLPGAARGRVIAPAGSDCDGLTLWIAPARLFEEVSQSNYLQRADELNHALGLGLQRLPPDGRFELTGLTPGRSKSFLVIDTALKRGHSFSGVRLEGSLELDEIDVPEGVMLEREFAPMEFPGSIVLHALVNGVPAPGLDLCVQMEAGPKGWKRLQGSTDATGRYRPERALPGVVRVWLEGREAGWTSEPTDVFVEAGRVTELDLPVTLAAATLSLVDAQDRPIANEPFIVLARDWVTPWSPIAARRSDAEGRIELNLVPAEYLLYRGEMQPGGPTGPSVPFTWTTSGPLAARLRF